MHNPTYQINPSAGLLRHFPGLLGLVRDGGEADNDAELLLEARVRSGDYIVTLATELEKLADGLAGVHAPEAAELERLTHELMGLNKHYRLVKK